MKLLCVLAALATTTALAAQPNAEVNQACVKACMSAPEDQRETCYRICSQFGEQGVAFTPIGPRVTPTMNSRPPTPASSAASVGRVSQNKSDSPAAVVADSSGTESQSARPSSSPRSKSLESTSAESAKQLPTASPSAATASKAKTPGDDNGEDDSSKDAKSASGASMQTSSAASLTALIGTASMALAMLLSL
ncbi:hypothetical protein GQ54DRAFT_10608 [Martensiomyces pterosporus]|nr:hypothetical protein GQ54DRAFT_10608 [Martensiomyces pterosporus]